VLSSCFLTVSKVDIADDIALDPRFDEVAALEEETVISDENIDGFVSEVIMAVVFFGVNGVYREDVEETDDNKEGLLSCG